jgi:HEAT repeat protein
VGSKDESLRNAAIRALAKIPTVESLQVLSAAFRDGSVRDAACKAIVAIGGAKAADVLIPLLDSDEPWCRAEAARALEEVRDSRAVEPLRRRLDDPEPGVRPAAARALQALKWTATDDRERLLYATARDAWQELAALGDAGVPALTALAGRHDGTGGSALIALAKMDAPSAITPLVLALMGDGSILDLARTALSEKHPGWHTSPEAALAVPRLIEHLSGGDSNDEQRAAEILGQIGDQRAIVPLMTALRDKGWLGGEDSYPVRSAALKALQGFGDAPLEALIAEFGKGDVNEHIGKALVALADTARRAAPRLIAACCEAGNLTSDGLDALMTLDINDARLFDPMLRQLFPVEVGSVGEQRKKKFERLLPFSSLTREMLDDAIAAATYEWETKWGGYKNFEHWTIHKLEVSDAAIDRLCRNPSPVVSNILHLVAGKENACFTTGRDGEDFVNVNFADQRARAAKELARRGSPPYDLEAYLRQAGARIT